MRQFETRKAAKGENFARDQVGVTARQRVPARGTVSLAPTNVSVVIPCFNYARYLREAVESVLRQPDVSVEVIIVDDASTDNSVQVARGLATDARVRVLEQETNQGPVRTFNNGLNLVTGEFIVRLDADDLLTPGSLARAVSLAQAFPTVGLVYGHPVHFHDTLPPARTEARSWTVWPGGEWLEMRCRRGTNVITAPEVLMRASVVKEVGGQRDLAHSHDMEMWMRIAAFSDVGRINGADQAWHRDHDLSLSAREVDMVSDLYNRRDAFDVLFAELGMEKLNVPMLHRHAMQALSNEALSLAAHQFDRGREYPEVTERLVAFAQEVAADHRLTRQWSALQRRIRMAPLLKTFPVFLPSALARRFRHDLERRRWVKHGI